MTGIYEVLSDVAAEIAEMPQRERLATVVHFADELRGFLDDSDLSDQERREVITRLVGELQREVTQ